MIIMTFYWLLPILDIIMIDIRGEPNFGGLSLPKPITYLNDTKSSVTSFLVPKQLANGCKGYGIN